MQTATAFYLKGEGSVICPACQKELDEGTLKCPFCNADLGSDEKTTDTFVEEEPVVAIAETELSESPDEQEQAATEEAELPQNVATGEETEPKYQNSEEFFKKYDLFDTERQSLLKTEKANAKKQKRRSKWGLLIVLIIVLAVVASIVFLIKGIDKNDGNGTESSNSNIADISSVSDATSEDETASKPDSKLDNKTIVGDWEFTISVNEMNAIGNPETADTAFESDAEYKLVLRFNDDKTVQLVCAIDDYKASYKAYMEDYFTYLRNGGYYEIREKEGYSKEQTDKMLADTGMTVDLLVDDLQEKMQSEDVTVNKTLTEDGCILLTDPAKITKYTLEKGKLIFVTDEDLTRETNISFEFESGIINVIDGTYADGMLVGKKLTKK